MAPVSRPVRFVPSAEEALDALLAIIAVARSQTPDELVEKACEQLAGLLRLEVAIHLVGDEDGEAQLRPVAVAVPPEVVSWPTWEELSALPVRVHQEAGGSDVVRASSGTELVLPLAELGALVLRGPGACAMPDRVELVVAEVAAVVAQSVRAAREDRARGRDVAVASALHQLLQAGISAGTQLEAASALARTMAKALDVDTACTCLFDDSGVITDVVAFGATLEQVEAVRAHLVGSRIGDSPVGRRVLTARSGEPVLLSDTGESGVVRRSGMAQSLGLRCLAAAPLLSSDGPVGVVTIGGSTGTRQWHRRDADLLAELAVQGTLLVDNARLREAERRQARSDELTGLANRRTFHEQLDSDVDRALTSSHPLAVLNIDLDGFKQVNDAYGHQQGDELLRLVAGRLLAHTRRDDVVARLGGDEFGIVLGRHVDGESPMRLATRLQHALQQPFELERVTVGVGASIGVASYASGETVAALLQRADQAMYEAKRGGGGCRLAVTAGPRRTVD